MLMALDLVRPIIKAHNPLIYVGLENFHVLIFTEVVEELEMLYPYHSIKLNPLFQKTIFITKDCANRKIVFRSGRKR